ncbi:hypothetical protein TNCV_2296351 [Trichonephila clavipes]|nr:hypothetical protein TNCV_2296351 [Trichonephila clavipes]
MREREKGECVCVCANLPKEGLVHYKKKNKAKSSSVIEIVSNTQNSRRDAVDDVSFDNSHRNLCFAFRYDTTIKTEKTDFS